MQPPLPSLSPEEQRELQRRQRGRNAVMLIALIVLAALFYAIAMVKFRVS